MADDTLTLTLTIDEKGVISPERAAASRLAARPGRYRLVPSSANLVILERLEAEPEKTSAGRMLLSGEIAALGGLVDVIHLIHSSRWSGQFSVLDGTVRKAIYFHHGEINAAASNLPEDKIGAILYRYGVITAEQLEHALKAVTGDQKFGQILVDSGIITTHELYQYVRKQIEEIFHSILAQRSGEFYFYRTGDDNPPSQLQLSTNALLFDGVRRMDEMSYFREKIPNASLVPQRTAQPDDGVSPRELRVLGMVDGKRDVSALARDSHLGEFETTKTLFQLIRSGHIEMREAGATIEIDAEPMDPTEVAQQVIAIFNETYAKIHRAVATQGEEKLDQLRRGLESFFMSVTEFAPLYVGVAVAYDGTLPADVVLANLEMAPALKKLDYLYRGLNELLFFELFTAGEVVDRREEAVLHQRLHEILRDMPQTRSAETAKEG